MYKHQDTDEGLVSLHDCKATKAEFKDNVLTFYFSNGIWILREHPDNDLNETVRTNAAEVAFHIPGGGDEIDFYVYKQKNPKKDIRKCWPVEKLVRKINSGEAQLEFLYQYRNGFGRIVECCLYKDKKPYLVECELKIRTDNVVYLWNDVYPEAIW